MTKENARRELEQVLGEQLNTYRRLIESSRRIIEREELQIKTYEAKIAALREKMGKLSTSEKEQS